MFTYSHSVETAASADAVWATYADVPGWPVWDHGMESATLDGPFDVGTAGVVSLRGVGAFPFSLTSVTPGREFSDETPFGPVLVRFEHFLEPLPGGAGTRITHRVTVTGPGEDEVGQNVVGDVPDAMESLARFAAEG